MGAEPPLFPPANDKPTVVLPGLKPPPGLKFAPGGLKPPPEGFSMPGFKPTFDDDATGTPLLPGKLPPGTPDPENPEPPP